MRHWFWLAICVAIGCCSSSLVAETPATQPTPIILLKLDDVGGWISPRWERVADYLKQNQIPASFGIIGAGLEKAGDPTVKWIKTIHDEGLIEFWCHGYTARKPTDLHGEFEIGAAEDQTALLRKAEDIAKQKLGFDLVAFGPHWSGTTDETEKAVEATPEIKIWLYGPAKPKYFTRLSIPRVMALENPTFVPDFDKFKAAYDKFGHKQHVLVLQGHPDQWSKPERWEGFVKIVEFLRSQGCTFMTPSQYLATVQKEGPAK